MVVAHKSSFAHGFVASTPVAIAIWAVILWRAL